MPVRGRFRGCVAVLRDNDSGCRSKKEHANNAYPFAPSAACEVPDAAPDVSPAITTFFMPKGEAASPPPFLDLADRKLGPDWSSLDRELDLDRLSRPPKDDLIPKSRMPNLGFTSGEPSAGGVKLNLEGLLLVLMLGLANAEATPLLGRLG